MKKSEIILTIPGVALLSSMLFSHARLASRDMEFYEQGERAQLQPEEMAKIDKGVLPEDIVSLTIPKSIEKNLTLIRKNDGEIVILGENKLAEDLAKKPVLLKVKIPETYLEGSINSYTIELTDKNLPQFIGAIKEHMIQEYKASVEADKGLQR